MAFTFGSITVPSLASVYNEAALKRQMDTSVHLQNFFLYFYGALFNLLGTAVMLTVSRQPAGSMFQGLSKVGTASLTASFGIIGLSRIPNLGRMHADKYAKFEYKPPGHAMAALDDLYSSSHVLEVTLPLCPTSVASLLQA